MALGDHLGETAYEDASNLVCEVAGADDNAIDVNAFRVGKGRVSRTFWKIWFPF